MEIRIVNGKTQIPTSKTQTQFRFKQKKTILPLLKPKGQIHTS
jgi:hypothetical protein